MHKTPASTSSNQIERLLYFELSKKFGVDDFDTTELSTNMWKLLEGLSCESERAEKRSSMQETVGISSRPYFSSQILRPLMELGLVQQTKPEKPRHPEQRYYLTLLGGLLGSKLYKHCYESKPQ